MMLTRQASYFDLKSPWAEVWRFRLVSMAQTYFINEIYPCWFAHRHMAGHALSTGMSGHSATIVIARIAGRAAYAPGCQKSGA
jgi:hypothetical protein